jgi:hypothetical protein
MRWATQGNLDREEGVGGGKRRRGGKGRRGGKRRREGKRRRGGKRKPCQKYHLNDIPRKGSKWLERM